MRSIIRGIGATKSATPVASALRGIIGYSASAGSCTKMTPPASLTARTPCAPSEPAPDRMTDSPSPRPAAIERKNMSIGARLPRGSVNGRARTSSPWITSSRSGGMTKTQFGDRRDPASETSCTCMCVTPPNISLSALGWSGAR